MDISAAIPVRDQYLELVVVVVVVVVVAAAAAAAQL